jgi:hypothetical protein
MEDTQNQPETQPQTITGIEGIDEVSKKILVATGILVNSKDYPDEILILRDMLINHEIYVSLKNNILELKKKNVNRIIGYGAPAKASLSINYFNLSKKLEFVIDNNNLKQKKYIPGTTLIIKPLKELRKYKKIDLIIVLAWNYYKEIKSSLKKFPNKVISIKDLY